MDRHDNTDNSLVRMKSRLKSQPVPYFLHSTHQHFDNTIPWRLGWCSNIALDDNQTKSKSMDRHNNTNNSLLRRKSRLKSPPVPYFLHSTHQHFDNTISWRLGWFSNIALDDNQTKSKSMDRHNNTDNSLVRMKSRLESQPVPYFLHSTHQHFDNTIPWRLGWFSNIALDTNQPKSK